MRWHIKKNVMFVFDVVVVTPGEIVYAWDFCLSLTMFFVFLFIVSPGTNIDQQIDKGRCEIARNSVYLIFLIFLLLWNAELRNVGAKLLDEIQYIRNYSIIFQLCDLKVNSIDNKMPYVNKITQGSNNLKFMRNP